jgi:arabinofuranosyltransferase
MLTRVHNALLPQDRELAVSRVHPNWLYRLAVVGSALVVGFYLARYFDFSRPPEEDAAMLMRYAQHIAQGIGIVWNRGEKPVDGGTDFLFMVVLAALVKCGLTVEWSARVVGIAAHVLTVGIVYLSITRLHKASHWLALISAAYLAVGPAIAYINAYFGTTFFALFAAATWYFANRLIQSPDAHRNVALFTLSALGLGFSRPEGVLLAILMLLAIVYVNGLRASRRTSASFFVAFLLIGGAYFLWRWSYFGHPLPNPYYKKGGGHLYVDSLLTSMKNVLTLSGPFTLAFILGLRSPKIVRRSIFLGIPVLGYTLMWVLLSNETNYLARFQYAVLPLILMSWTDLVKGLHGSLRLPPLRMLDAQTRVVLLSAVALVSLAVLWYPHSLDAQQVRFSDGNYAIGTMLSSYRHKGYTLATTEAGLLPLYSDWRTVDTWGLNDQWIAHHGQITETYLDQYKPELIVFHAYYSSTQPRSLIGPTEAGFRGWLPMVLTLKHYAESHQYILAAEFGVSPYNVTFFYVRRGFPDSATIIHAIQNTDYRTPTTGQRCVNFALTPLPSQ